MQKELEHGLQMRQSRLCSKCLEGENMLTAVFYITEYLAYAHAITGDFGAQGGSVSKIKYYVNM